MKVETLKGKQYRRTENRDVITWSEALGQASWDGFIAAKSIY